MSFISLKWFGGMVPRRGRQHLDVPTATEAENCNLYSGELRPLKAPALAHTFCRPGDACWRDPLPDDPSVPPEPPDPPPQCTPIAITSQLPEGIGDVCVAWAPSTTDATMVTLYQSYTGSQAPDTFTDRNTTYDSGIAVYNNEIFQNCNNATHPNGGPSTSETLHYSSNFGVSFAPVTDPYDAYWAACDGSYAAKQAVSIFWNVIFDGAGKAYANFYYDANRLSTIASTTDGGATWTVEYSASDGLFINNVNATEYGLGLTGYVYKLELYEDSGVMFAGKIGGSSYGALQIAPRTLPTATYITNDNSGIGPAANNGYNVSYLGNWHYATSSLASDYGYIFARDITAGGLTITGNNWTGSNWNILTDGAPYLYPNALVGYDSDDTNAKFVELPDTSWALAKLWGWARGPDLINGGWMLLVHPHNHDLEADPLFGKLWRLEGDKVVETLDYSALFTTSHPDDIPGNIYAWRLHYVREAGRWVLLYHFGCPTTWQGWPKGLHMRVSSTHKPEDFSAPLRITAPSGRIWPQWGGGGPQIQYSKTQAKWVFWSSYWNGGSEYYTESTLIDDIFLCSQYQTSGSYYLGDLAVGTPVVLSVTGNVDATPPVMYQWYRNGIALPGEVGPAYSFTATVADTGASFFVLVQNPCGQAVSEEWLLGQVA